MENPIHTETGTSVGVPPPASGSDVSGRPKFELDRYNPRRHARGAEAANVKFTWPDGDVEYLWMSERDVRKNMVTWGVCAGLTAAQDAYRQNTADDRRAPTHTEP